MNEHIQMFEHGDHVVIRAKDAIWEGIIVAWTDNDWIKLSDHGSDFFVAWEDIISLDNMNNRNSETIKSTIEMVNHPAHYQSESGLEVFDVIEAFTADLKGVDAFDMGNVIKYVCRWKHKNGLEDLKKAMVYLERVINRLEKENE